MEWPKLDACVSGLFCWTLYFWDSGCCCRSPCSVFFNCILMPHSLLLHAAVNGHWGCLPFGAVMNSATLSIFIKTFMCLKGNVSLLPPFPTSVWFSARCFLVGIIKLWCSKASKILLRKSSYLKWNPFSALLPAPFCVPSSEECDVERGETTPMESNPGSNPGPVLSELCNLGQNHRVSVYCA